MLYIPNIQSVSYYSVDTNYMCPDENLLDKGDEGYNAEKLCKTGCVATAMAQIMYYWKWPNECPALDSYPIGYRDDDRNFIETNRVKGLPATTFKWDKMKTAYENGETGDAVDAVAELMRYCGQAFRMEYSIGESGAGMYPSAMASVFNYSKNAHVKQRDDYSTAQWETLVYEELKAKRPVPYSGYDDRRGHQFIVDGYRGDGLFHFNWGWSGGSYSVLSVADPATEIQIVRGNGNNNVFQYGQCAWIGMKPAEADEMVMPIIYASLNKFMAKTYSRPNENADFTDVALNASVFYQYLETERDVQLGWGLYRDDKFVMCLASQTKKLHKPPYNWIDNSMTVSFGAGLEAGKYQLCQIFRFSDNEQWQRCEEYWENSLLAEVDATSMTIRKPDLKNMSFIVNSLTPSENPEAENPMKFVVNVTNTGESLKVILNLWIQKDGANSWTNVAQGECYVDPDKSMDIYFGYTPMEAGTYNLKVTGISDLALFTSTVTIAATEIVVVDNVKYFCTPAYKHAMVIQNEDVESDISSITIQKTVTASGVACQVKTIADYAFYCFWNIRKIEIPEGVETIGSYAFHCMSNLQKLVLPSSIQSIGDGAFSYNKNLISIESHITEPFDISESVFAGSSTWDDTNNVYISSPSSAKLYVPLGTKSKYVAAMGWNMFVAIEEGELMECFESVLKYSYSTGGDEATVIQDDSYKQLTEVTIPSTMKINGKSYKVTGIGNSAFYDCKNIVSVTLPDGLVSIGKNSFQNTGIKKIAFPNTLKSIGPYAFYHISSLQKLVLPSSIQSIGDRAFSCNQNLTSVESHITEPFDVSESVFSGSSTWDDTNNIYICSQSSAKLYVPVGTKSKYLAANGWNMFVAIEEGELMECFEGVLKYSYSTGGDEATVIQDDNYKQLAEVTIPSTVTINGKSYKVTGIGNSAFYDCWKISSVTLPDGLVSIGNLSFRNIGIKEIAFPNTLKSIGDEAFRHCWLITEIKLPDKLESIGELAFSYISNLRKVVLPSTIQSISGWAFFKNQNLTLVESHITEPFDISESVFAGSSTLYVPVGTKSKYETAKGWNRFTNIEEMEPTTLPGDADGSGDVNAADIDTVVQFIMTGKYDSKADLNHDNKVNAADLVLLINMVP